MRQLQSVIRILLAEDHRLVRESLVSLLNAVPDFDVIGTAGDGAELLAMLRYKTPNIILLDIRMPRLNGIEVVRRLSEDKPWIRIIVLSMYFQSAHVKDMLRSGVHGYVSKHSHPEELYEAVRKVHSGKTYLAKAVQDVVIQDFADRGTELEREEHKPLSLREIKIIQLLSDGHLSTEIAERLMINEKTVERDKAMILKKLNVKNTPHLIKTAIEKGLLTEKINLIS